MLCCKRCFHKKYFEEVKRRHSFVLNEGDMCIIYFSTQLQRNNPNFRGRVPRVFGAQSLRLQHTEDVFDANMIPGMGSAKSKAC